MTKLLGSILVIWSVVLIICTPIIFLKKRTEILFDFIKVLRRMNNELNTNLWSIPDLMQRVYDDCPVSIIKLFACIIDDVNEYGAAVFHDSWKKGLEEYRKYFLMDEYTVLESLGSILGRYCLNEQLSDIDKALIILENGYKSARDKFQKDFKLYVSLGSAIGSMIAVLFL